MNATLAPMLQELEQESLATRRALERVPDDRLTWRPHPSSMSLGQLALHVATVPATLLTILEMDGLDVTTVDFSPAEPQKTSEILEAFERSLGDARKRLQGFDAAWVSASWTLSKGSQVLFTQPRAALVRSLLLNHLYHHRGQLTVYLRLVGAKVPAIYGNSADENPFA